jgi:protein-histidine N-methyltransferase
MGKKQQHGKSAKPKLSTNKRNELKVLADAILVKGREKYADEFKHFSEFYGLLERIKLIESEIKAPYKSTRDDEVIEKFIGWCQQQGAKFSKIQLKKLNGNDLGLFAKETLKKDETFIEIPDSMIFSFSKIYEELPEILKHRVFLDCPLFDGMSHVRLAFALMVEKLSPNSKFKPYLDILPDKFRTVLYLSPAEMKELQGTVALSSAIKQVKFIATQYAFLYKYLMVAVEDHPVLDELKNNFTFEFYCWAVSAVMTRQNIVPQGEKGEPESVLVGLWDMANHSNGVINTAFNEETKSIESFCLTDFKAGDQVTMAYGSRSNEEFFIHNGFVFPENTNKNFNIVFSLSKADELYDGRSKLLEKLGVKTSGQFQISPTFSNELLAFVRVFNMNKEQLNKWLEAENFKELLSPDLNMDKAIEKKILMFLLMRVKILLKAFPTTIEEDQALLETQTNKTKLLLIQYRILEKKALKEISIEIEEMMKKV